MASTRLDTDTFEYDAFADPAVGDPTKLSELQKLKENIEHSEESAVQGRVGQSVAQCLSELNGVAVLQCNVTLTNSNSTLLIDASEDLPFDTSDVEKMTLLDRYIQIKGRGLIIVDVENALEWLPGGIYDDGFNEGGNDNGETVDRFTIDEDFISGPGTAAYDTNAYWRAGAHIELTAAEAGKYYYLYFWVNEATGDLYVRFQKDPLNAPVAEYEAAFVCMITVGPRMTHYVAP
jgi:hypothetical protein